MCVRGGDTAPKCDLAPGGGDPPLQPRLLLAVHTRLFTAVPCFSHSSSASMPISWTPPEWILSQASGVLLQASSVHETPLERPLERPQHVAISADLG